MQLAEGTRHWFPQFCRQTPWELNNTYDGLGSSLIQKYSGGRNTPRNAPILRAAAQGKSAFGSPGQVTDFTQVLLRGLRGAGAKEEGNTDHWFVPYTGLLHALHVLLENDPPAGVRRQEFRWGGDASEVNLTHLRNPPRVTVQIDCLPPDTAQYATLKLSSQLCNFTRSRQPSVGPWRERDVPVDYAYQLAAKYDNGRYPASALNVSVLPPLQRLHVPVTP
ncbi:hypothetical protein ACIQZO_17930 [Streptomyces sp. NPDC097617]|uniref:hypothetical protein n=1 Tax=Streptomyces sp. NPDC097617 TaxID=3366091 RepID=UPI0038199500